MMRHATTSAEPITILMPCRAQRRDLLLDAIRSVTAQTSPAWRLLVIVDADTPAEVRGWSADRFTSALRHDPRNPAYDANVRQLLHVGYKIAAKMGRRYTDLLVACEASVSRNVTQNLLERHLAPLFLGP